MQTLKTQQMRTSPVAQITINTVGVSIIWEWLHKGIKDLTQCPTLALFHGVLFWGMSYSIWSLLDAQQTMHDVSAPLLAIIILIFGPIFAMSLYSVSKKLQSGETLSLLSIQHVFNAVFKAKKSFPSLFLSLFLLILAISWMIFTPLIYAVFHSGSLHIVETSQHTIINSIIQNIVHDDNILYLLSYGSFTALLGWFAFMISWFSFPMVFDQDVDAFTATVASIKTANANKVVMIFWIPIVVVLIAIALLLPYFLGLIVVIPLLAHSTWHAYKSLIGEVKNTENYGI